MRLLTTLCVISLAAAGTAQASQTLTDRDYIRAHQCLGLALGSGESATALETLVRENRQGRANRVQNTARAMKTNAQRQMQRATGEAREQLARELAQDCAALTA